MDRGRAPNGIGHLMILALKWRRVVIMTLSLPRVAAGKAG